jgi:hypothetical protein
MTRPSKKPAAKSRARGDDQFGRFKLSLYLELDANPGAHAERLAEALQALGIDFSAINQDVGKQAPFTQTALVKALSGHQTASFGRTTLLLEQPKAKLHGPVSWVRVRTSAYFGRANGPQPKECEQYPASIEAFWDVSPERPALTRDLLDHFVDKLGTELAPRVGAAGVTFAVIERPMLKDAPAALAALGRALLERPHAHANHLAVLDTRRHAVEPAWWMFIGAKLTPHVERADLAAFAPSAVAGGIGVATAQTSPVEPAAAVIAAQVALASALGAAYPPQVVADATFSPKTQLADGTKLTIRRWMQRYQDAKFARDLSLHVASARADA